MNIFGKILFPDSINPKIQINFTLHQANYWSGKIRFPLIRQIKP